MTTQLSPVNGKSVVITGGSRGIGRAAAIQAAQRGWAVTINYVGNVAAAVAVVAEIEGFGGRAVAVQGDVAKEADVLRLFAESAKLAPIGAVVVNAGIVAPPSQLADISVERLQRMFDVNVLGAYLCAREGARCLSQSRGGPGGSIVLVSSRAAALGSPGEYVDYAGSKGAVDTLTLGLSKELAKEGVRVNAVRPGLIDTDIHASGSQPDRAWRVGKLTPMGRPGTADEVAEAILWFMSDASSYANGALLDVSGGR